MQAMLFILSAFLGLSGLVHIIGYRDALGTSRVWCFNVDHLMCMQTSLIWVHVYVLKGWCNTCWPKMLSAWNVWYVHADHLIYFNLVEFRNL